MLCPNDMNQTLIIKSSSCYLLFSFQDSFTLLPKRDMSVQTEISDDDTSTLDSGFDNENVLVETLQSRLYESLKVFFDAGYLNTFFLSWSIRYT